MNIGQVSQTFLKLIRKCVNNFEELKNLKIEIEVSAFGELKFMEQKMLIKLLN